MVEEGRRKLVQQRQDRKCPARRTPLPRPAAGAPSIHGGRQEARMAFRSEISMTSPKSESARKSSPMSSCAPNPASSSTEGDRRRVIRSEISMTSPKSRSARSSLHEFDDQRRLSLWHSERKIRPRNEDGDEFRGIAVTFIRKICHHLHPVWPPRWRRCFLWRDPMCPSGR